MSNTWIDDEIEKDKINCVYNSGKHIFKSENIPPSRSRPACTSPPPFPPTNGCRCACVHENVELTGWHANQVVELPGDYALRPRNNVKLQPGEGKWVPVQVNGEIDPDQWYAVMPAQSLLEKGLEVKAFTPFLEHGPHRGKSGIFVHNFQSTPFQIRSNQRVGTIAGVQPARSRNRSRQLEGDQQRELDVALRP